MIPINHEKEVSRVLIFEHSFCYMHVLQLGHSNHTYKQNLKQHIQSEFLFQFLLSEQ